jgi:hypothetical protein
MFSKPKEIFEVAAFHQDRGPSKEQGQDSEERKSFRKELPV